jgi:glyoxylase I family protein
MAIHVAGVTPLLEVFDMRRSVAFYRDVLGFDVVQEWAPDGNLYWAMLKLGAAVLMLNARYEVAAQPAEPDAARSRRAHGHGTVLRLP